MEQGPFLIVFEGIDGSGKGTQARLLKKALTEENLFQSIDIVYTREPSENDLGKIIRDGLRVQQSDARILALLFAADRVEHLYKEIIPALSKGKIVICERYVYSSFAYQGIDVNIQWLADINNNALVPDIVFYLDVPFNTAHERIIARNGVDNFNKKDPGKNKKEFFEKQMLFLNSVNERFKEIEEGKININCSPQYRRKIEFSDTHVYKIDASLPINQTHQTILEIVGQLLSGKINRIVNRYDFNAMKKTQKKITDFSSFKIMFKTRNNTNDNTPTQTSF